MIARMRRFLLGWVSDPNQALLRQELRFAVRWCGRPAGIAWLLAFLGFGCADAMLTKDGVGMLPSFTIRFLAAVVLITSILDRRTFAPFRGRRLEEILVTPVNSDSLWPALLVAPSFAASAAMTASTAGSFTAMLIVDFVEAPFAIFSTSVLDVASLAILGIMTFALNMIFWLAVSSDIVGRTFPHGGAIPTAKAIVLVSIYLYLVTAMIGIVAFAPIFLLMMTPYFDSPAASPWITAVLTVWFALGFALFLFFIYREFKRNVAHLRSDAMMNRLRTDEQRAGDNAVGQPGAVQAGGAT